MRGGRRSGSQTRSPSSDRDLDAGSRRSSVGFASLLRPHRWRLAAGALCLVLLAVTGAAYAYLCGPVVQVVLTGGERGAGYLGALAPWMPQGAGVPAGPSALLLVATALVAIALAKGAAGFGQAMLLGGAAERVGHTLRTRLYAHLIRLPLSEHRRLPLGEGLTKLIDDVQRVQDAAVALPVVIVRESLGAAALLSVAVWMSPLLALVAAVALPLAALVIGVLSRAVKRAAAERQERMARLADRASLGLAAVREVKSCGAEERELEQVRREGQGALAWALRSIRARATAPLINEVMATTALGGTLVLAGAQIARGALPPERFISFFAAVLMLYRPIKLVGNAVHQLAAARASVERVDELLRRPGEELSGDGAPLPPLEESMRLEGVAFEYASAEGGAGRRALTAVDLELRKGTLVALAGPSGAGKSTLANIVAGLDSPTAGRVSWDGDEITFAPPGRRRSQVALVPQQPLLLPGSVAENLRYGNPAATDEQLLDAVTRVGLEQLLGQLEGGLDALLGPRGVELSAGEAQRLAVGRALLRPASLLVLDEPSSALDPVSEARLLQALETERQQRAVLVVAHRPELLAAADVIIELAAGRVVRRQAARSTADPAAVHPGPPAPAARQRSGA